MDSRKRIADIQRSNVPDSAILFVVHHEDSDAGGCVVVLESQCNAHPLVLEAWRRVSAPDFPTRVDVGDDKRFRDCELLIAGGSEEGASDFLWPIDNAHEGATQEAARREFIEQGDKGLIMRYPKTPDSGRVWDSDTHRLLKIIALWTWM